MNRTKLDTSEGVTGAQWMVWFSRTAVNHMKVHTQFVEGEESLLVDTVLFLSNYSVTSVGAVSELVDQRGNQ